MLSLLFYYASESVWSFLLLQFIHMHNHYIFLDCRCPPPGMILPIFCVSVFLVNRWPSNGQEPEHLACSRSAPTGECASSNDGMRTSGVNILSISTKPYLLCRGALLSLGIFWSESITSPAKNLINFLKANAQTQHIQFMMTSYWWFFIVAHTCKANAANATTSQCINNTALYCRWFWVCRAYQTRWQTCPRCPSMKPEPACIFASDHSWGLHWNPSTPPIPQSEDHSCSQWQPCHQNQKAGHWLEWRRKHPVQRSAVICAARPVIRHGYDEWERRHTQTQCKHQTREPVVRVY